MARGRALQSKHLYIMYATLVLLIAWGGLLRFYDLGAQSYWMDEGYTVNAVQALQEKGEPILDSGLPYSCPMYCWPTALIANTFGNTETSYRFLAAAAGTAFIAAIFFITRSMFATNVALLSTAFIALSYIHIAWSRQARWYTFFTLFFWLALYFFYRALYHKEHQTQNYTLAGIATVLACLTHTLGLLLPPIFIAWALIERVRLRLPGRTMLLGCATACIAIALLALTSKSIPYAGLVNHITPTFGFPYYASFYLREYWFLLPFVALAFLLPSPHKRPAVFLMVALTAYLIPLTLFTETVQYRYMFHLTPVLYIVGAAGALALYTRLRAPAHKRASSLAPNRYSPSSTWASPATLSNTNYGVAKSTLCPL